MQSREMAELDIARATIARLEPAITNRSATPRQKHTYWDALDVVRHYQDADERVRVTTSGSTAVMSHTMPNPINMADLGKIFFTTAGVIILIGTIVSLYVIAVGSLS